MQTTGQQLLLDLWLRDSLSSEQLSQLCNYVRSTFTVVREIGHDFEPEGLTYVMVLAESHFCIHTYPEHKYLSLDLYMCKSDIDLNVIKNDILGMFTPRTHRSQIMRRGEAPAEELTHGATSQNGRSESIAFGAVD